MTPLQKILESKRRLRRVMSSRPVAEKLRMLDAMRERHVVILESAQRTKPRAGARMRSK